MKLIVGLGNPGRQYVATRHNVGFELVDQLAASIGWVSTPGDFDRVARTKFEGLFLDGNFADEKLVLLKPMTFMNVSGKSVQQAMAFYQIPPADVLVVLDDLALPCGRLRIRGSGSSGGHNGLNDIERMIGTKEYPRLRIGIDAAPQFVPAKDYVLGRFSEEQRKLLDPAIKRAVDAARVWIEKATQTAMNQFNAESGSGK